MKIDDVDQFIESVFEVPQEALYLAEEWLSITRLLAEAIAKADDLLIIQAHSDRYEVAIRIYRFVMKTMGQ
jgi:hypothetical protein